MTVWTAEFGLPRLGRVLKPEEAFTFVGGARAAVEGETLHLMAPEFAEGYAAWNILGYYAFFCGLGSDAGNAPVFQHQVPGSETVAYRLWPYDHHDDGVTETLLCRLSPTDTDPFVARLRMRPLALDFDHRFVTVTSARTPTAP